MSIRNGGCFYPVLALPAAALLALAGQEAFTGAAHPFPPPSAIREVRRGASEDALALGLGLRRLAADLWFIRLMQYYGTEEPERSGEEAEEAVDPGHGEPGHHCAHEHFGEGRYPEFASLARHILALDPYFTNAGLYAAGSLAFNMNRPAEAVELLNEALLYRPKEWKYLTLLAAIGYSRASDPSGVLASIEPLLNEPDCPVMLRQLAAFLNKKAGRYRTAYLIYASMLTTTKDRFYLENARREMARLEGKPDLVEKVRSPG